jgi:hypothetical protein
LRFDLLFGVAVGAGVGEAFFRFGEVSGEGVGVAFCFRCFRLGVGDGWKAFLIFVPNDSSAARGVSMAPSKIAIIKIHLTKFKVPPTPSCPLSSAENRASD